MKDNYKIMVYSTCIIINNYNWGENPNLENSFRIWDPVTHTSNYKAIVYDKDSKTLILPKGIDLSYIENIFNTKAYITNSPLSSSDINHMQSYSERILLKYAPKDDKQREAMKFLIGQDKYYYTKGSSQLFLALNTGAGKTYLGIAYIAYMNLPTVIITASVEWLKQWKARIIEHTNIQPKNVKFIHGSSEINNILNNPDNERYKGQIYLLTHATILSYANTNGWDSIGKLFKILNIGIKIFDEAHLNFDNMYLIDFNTNIYRTLYLSATPGRGEEKENEIFSLYFKNVPRITLFDPEEDPRTNYIAIRYKSGLTAQELSSCINLRGFNKMIYCDKIIYKENFDHLMRILMNMISCIPGKKLIFMATNNAISFMYEWIESNYPEYHNCVGIYTSLNKDKMSALQYPLILTTSKSAGAALDVDGGISCSIQLAEPTKTEFQNRQRLGRTRGRNTFYIDIIDDDCAVSKKYYIANLPMFETYALSIKEIRFNNKELKAQSFNIMKKREEVGISPFIKL